MLLNSEGPKRSSRIRSQSVTEPCINETFPLLTGVLEASDTRKCVRKRNLVQLF